MSQLKIRTHLVLVQVIFRFLGFLEIITPVPALGLVITAFLLDLGVDIGQFLFRFRQGRRPDFIEQVVHVLLVLRHILFQYESGIILISHQSGFLQTSGNQLLNDLLIIILIIIVATIRIRLEDLLTQITLIGVLKERHHARIMEGKHPLTIQTILLGRLRRLDDHVFRQTG